MSPLTCIGIFVDACMNVWTYETNGDCNCNSTKCNVHVIFYGVQVSPHISDDFHVKVVLLALPAYHLVTLSLHGLHVSVSGDRGKPCFIWCHIKKKLKSDMLFSFRSCFWPVISNGLWVTSKKTKSMLKWTPRTVFSNVTKNMIFYSDFCYLNVMNVWCCVCYAYNLKLLQHRCPSAISSFVHPLLWHFPLATSQSYSHSTLPNVSGFLSIHYQYTQTVDFHFVPQFFCNKATKITSTNEKIFFLPFLDFGRFG